MKRKVKNILNSIKRSAFKWDNDPIEIYKSLINKDDSVNISKKDMLNIMHYIIRKEYINDMIIKNLNNKNIGY